MAGQASGTKKASGSAPKSSTNSRSESSSQNSKAKKKKSNKPSNSNVSAKKRELKKSPSSNSTEKDVASPQQSNTGTQPNKSASAQTTAPAKSTQTTAAKPGQALAARNAAVEQAGGGAKDSNKASALQLVSVSAPVSAPTTAPALETQGIVNGIQGGLSSGISEVQGSISGGIASLQQSFSDLFKVASPSDTSHPLAVPPVATSPLVQTPNAPSPVENIPSSSSTAYERAIYYLTPKQGALKDAVNPSAIIVDISHNLQTVPPLNSGTPENIQTERLVSGPQETPKLVSNPPNGNSSELPRPEETVNAERPVNVELPVNVERSVKTERPVSSEEAVPAPLSIPSEPPGVQENELVQEGNRTELNPPEQLPSMTLGNETQPSVTPDSETQTFVGPASPTQTSVTSADETEPVVAFEQETIPLGRGITSAEPAVMTYASPPGEIVAEELYTPGETSSAPPGVSFVSQPTTYFNQLPLEATMLSTGVNPVAADTQQLIAENMQHYDNLQWLLNPAREFTATDLAQVLSQGPMAKGKADFYFSLFLRRLGDDVINLIIMLLAAMKYRRV